MNSIFQVENIGEDKQPANYTLLQQLIPAQYYNTGQPDDGSYTELCAANLYTIFEQQMANGLIAASAEDPCADMPVLDSPAELTVLHLGSNELGPAVISRGMDGTSMFMCGNNGLVNNSEMNNGRDVEVDTFPGTNSEINVGHSISDGGVHNVHASNSELNDNNQLNNKSQEWREGIIQNFNGDFDQVPTDFQGFQPGTSGIILTYETNYQDPSTPVSNGSLALPTPCREQEATEVEIDAAFQMVLDSFSRREMKDVARLDPETLNRCLSVVGRSHVLICNSCCNVFFDIPLFQVHVQTCCSPPHFETTPKMDQAAMDLLARTLWKGSFMQALSAVPNFDQFANHEDEIYMELDDLWKSCKLPVLMRCRELYIKSAINVVTHKWVASGIANELNRFRSAKPKKRSSIDMASETPTAPPTPLIKKIKENADETPVVKNARRNQRTRAKKRLKTDVSEIDRALESIDVNDQDFVCLVTLPDTPESDTGNDLQSLVLGDIDPFILETWDSRNDVAAAARQHDDPDVIEEGEFIVHKILERRRIDFEFECPRREDFEYLVSWEGYDDTENTWEPYDNLKRCVGKLQEFYETLNKRSRRPTKKGKK